MNPGDSMTRAPVLLLGLTLPILAGCSGNRFEQHWARADHGQAVRAFEADAGLQKNGDALFRAALVHAAADCEGCDPERARELLRRLIALQPDSDRAREAERLLLVLERLEALEDSLRSRDDGLRELQSSLEQVEERARVVELLLEHHTTRSELLLELNKRLEKDLVDAHAQLEALQEELRRLKEIDLKRTESGGPATAPDDG